MTNYYAYRNWLVKIEAHLFVKTKAYIFDLNSGEHHAFFAYDDTHKFVCDFIDMNYRDKTDYSVGVHALMALYGRDSMLAKEIFEQNIGPYEPFCNF